MKKLLLAGACMTALAFGSVLAVAQDDVVAQRQEAMKAVGGQIKILGGMAKGEVAFDAAKAAEAGKVIKANFEKAASLFPEGSGTEKSYAKPEVWQDAAGFKAALEKGLAAAGAMAAVTDEAGLKAAIGDLGGACKGCHDKFRRPKEG